jgi:hypothetical protein
VPGTSRARRSLDVVGLMWIDFSGEVFPFRAEIGRAADGSVSVVGSIGQVHERTGQPRRLPRGTLIVPVRDANERSPYRSSSSGGAKSPSCGRLFSNGLRIDRPGCPQTTLPGPEVSLRPTRRPVTSARRPSAVPAPAPAPRCSRSGSSAAGRSGSSSPRPTAAVAVDRLPQTALDLAAAAVLPFRDPGPGPSPE